MRSFCFAGLVAAVGLLGVGSAGSQTLPIDMVLSPPKRTTESAPAAEQAQGRMALTPPPLPTRFQPLRAPAAGIVAVPGPSDPSPAAPGKKASNGGDIASAPSSPVVIPPARPAAAAARPVPMGEPETVSARPMVAANAAPVIEPRQEALSDQEIVARANAFFTNLKTLVADFTQVSGDGRRVGGTLYLQRPGKVRFEYDKPSTLEVVADGSSVAVRDTKLATQDLYSIAQTPLKFLLRERVNLGQDIAITGIAREGDGILISLEDRSTLGGTSRIVLYFDRPVESLSQWRILDAQGYQTMVVLNKIDRPQRVDQSLFVINYDRAINTESSR
jgi:outer membrane lipoprotein-sorting protein